MAKKKSTASIEAAQAAHRKSVRDLLRRPGVTAVDVGYRYTGGEITDEIALRVHVERKLPPEAFHSYEMITGPDDPVDVDGVPIDVIEGAYSPATTNGAEVLDLEAVDRLDAVDPLIGGVSCGNPRISAGTLGAIVWDRTNGKQSILSNWHVLCGSTDCAAGESILQQGRLDGGTAADKVGELTRFKLNEKADAAVANLDGSRAAVRDILGLNPIAGVEDPALGMQVVKSGRTTAVTQGVIDGINLSTRINYGNGRVQTFHNQIRIVPRPPWPQVDVEISRGGDSGSVWINEANNKAIGLHFAGETDPAPTAENAIANRMVDVVEELNISFFPLVTRPVPRPPRRPAPVDDQRDRLRRIICMLFPQFCRTGSRQTETARSCTCDAASNSSSEAVDQLIDELLQV